MQRMCNLAILYPHPGLCSRKTKFFLKKKRLRIFFEILMKSWVVFSLFSTKGDYVKTVISLSQLK
jgi:hypothetical protein